MKEQEQVSWGWGPKQFLPQLWIHYKLQQTDYEALWARQGGCCAGCKVEFAHPLRREMRTGVKPEVDHLHVEGRRCERQDVRGLLCRQCNQFLGKIRDNKDRLRSLLDYLIQHGELNASLSEK